MLRVETGNYLCQSFCFPIAPDRVPPYKTRPILKRDENPLWKHCQIAHNSELVKFKMVCLKSFKSAFMRQVNEGVRIENSKADICMNSKAEFHQPSIVRVSTVLGNHNDEQTGGGGRGRGS